MIRKLRILAAAALLAGSAIAIMAASVSANGGPHQQFFGTTTDACAGCHRAHTGQAPSLLKANSQYNLCLSCHGGAGSDVDVKDGLYLGTTMGLQNAGLKGGGFETALLNVAALNATDGSFNVTGTPQTITSRHSVEGTGMIAWGSNQTGVGELVDLECANCHNPHGNDNYRILRPKPTALSWYNNMTAINITAGNSTFNISYTQVYRADGLFRDMVAMYNLTDAGNATVNATSPQYMMDDWCAQCHTRYMTQSGSGHTSSNSTPFLYRHNTSRLNGGCLQCHVAHGSPAAMSGYAVQPLWPDGNATQTWQSTANETQTGRLLVANNRGVCRQCHASTGSHGIANN